jgi:glycosyltransferase involved in cell wall biosynthesis
VSVAADTSTPPRFTIITPVLNRAAMVEEAIASVVAQRDFAGPVEHIVMDGGSTDGTQERVRRHPHVRLVSEPDAGLYDAIDKGLALARGDVVGLLNSDDLLRPGALAAVARALDAVPHADAACGGAEVMAAGGRLVARIDDEATKRLDFRTAMLGVPITNARFFRRDRLQALGGFDGRYRIAADRDLLIRSLKAGWRTVPVPGVVYEYRAHAGSLTIAEQGRQGRATRDEYLDLARHYRRDPQGSPEQRRAAATWLAVESAWLVVHRLRSQGLMAAVGCAAAGLANDPMWPGYLAGEIIGRILARSWR